MELETYFFYTDQHECPEKHAKLNFHFSDLRSLLSRRDTYIESAMLGMVNTIHTFLLKHISYLNQYCK